MVEVALRYNGLWRGFLLSIFSAAMGVLTGVVISYGFVMAFGLIGWQMSYVFPVTGIIAAIVIAILLAIFARTFVSAIPMETGMPVHLYIFSRIE